VNTFYTKIGPEKLRELVDRFYDILFESKIEHLFTTDRDLVRDKQYMFLTQFLGGPQLYSQSYGHPKMKMRHLPHTIDAEAKDEWLRCMRVAIDEMNFEGGLGDALYECFPRVANHMQNKG